MLELRRGPVAASDLSELWLLWWAGSRRTTEDGCGRGVGAVRGYGDAFPIWRSRVIWVACRLGRVSSRSRVIWIACRLDRVPSRSRVVLGVGRVSCRLLACVLSCCAKNGVALGMGLP